jgi:hypothetical protein
MIRTYTDLSQLQTYEERYAYLKLGGQVGSDTFGYERYLNQNFYRSVQWRNARVRVIARDYGCDLGAEGYEINDLVFVHHMNPLRPEDIIEGNPDIVDPEYLISVTHRTHQAIHYGDEKLLKRNQLVERRPDDTTLWR